MNLSPWLKYMISSTGLINNKTPTSMRKSTNNLPTPNEIIINQLNTLEQMKLFLQTIELLYRKSGGNLAIFRRSMRQQKICRLFNILIGIHVETRYFTRDYWDTLAFHLLIAWCQIYGLKYQTKHLVQVINEIKQTQLIFKKLPESIRANSKSSKLDLLEDTDDEPPITLKKSAPIPIPVPPKKY